jgi:putative phosphoribosyl transferase
MLDHLEMVVQNREHAIRLLYEKLLAYKGSNAVIVAIPPGGVTLGKNLASRLDFSLEILGSHEIRHPAHSHQKIGTVTADHVELQDSAIDIPSQYIYNQILQLKRRIELEDQFYSSLFPKQGLESKVVILADVFISDLDNINACLISIKKHNPSRIIVTSLLTTLGISMHLMKEGIEFHFLNMVMQHHYNAAHELCDDIYKGEESLASLISGLQPQH